MDDKRKILAADMWPSFNFMAPEDRRQTFLKIGAPGFINLLNSLLLYDEIVIPTQDFMIINILVGVLGEKGMIDCIERGNLSFVRARGQLGFAGSGGTVHGFCTLHAGIKRFVDTSSDDPYSASIDTALDWAYTGLITSKLSRKAKSFILDSTSEIEFSDIHRKIKEENILDTTASFLSNNYSEQEIREGRLEGLEPKDIRLFSTPIDDEQITDHASQALLVAYANAEFALANENNCTDMSTLLPIREILATKMRRVDKNHPLENFFDLREIAGVPDFCGAIINRKVEIKKLLDIRTSKDGREFRRWFHDNGFSDAKEVAQAYVQLLNQKSEFDSLPSRTIRFMATKAWSTIEPLSGTLASLANNFVLSRLFEKNPVKFFMEKLKRLDHE